MLFNVHVRFRKEYETTYSGAENVSFYGTGVVESPLYPLRFPGCECDVSSAV